ncbi:MAG: carboxypeptidase regulatory-like domain-containing protein, partial [Planctomycetes bacterium]|nr:carboxypeptidase regulatory-like domain-containing protein [Planctomycetota bacterium]
YGADGVPGGGDDIDYSAVTDANGIYQINDLPPGNYGAVVTGIPNGLTTPTFDPAPFNLVSGVDRDDIDFGFTGTAALGDLVWNDQDASRLQEPGEPGLPGEPVQLTWTGFDGIPGTPDDIVYTTTTDANGNYLFTNLPVGFYSVEVLPAPILNGMSLTTPTNPLLVYLPLGTTNLDADFGYRGSASVGDFVWYDINGDGVQDPGEPGIPGAEVTLTSGGSDGDLATPGDNLTYVTTADANGLYLFSGLPGGAVGAGPNYRAEVTSLPPIYTTPTYDLDGIATPNQADFTLDPQQNRRDVDFGYNGSGELGDFVWDDLNGNGIQDAGEPGVAGVTVELRDAGGNLLASTMTDASGLYTLTGLVAGDYEVVFVAPAGFIFSPQNQGNDDALDSDA